MESAGPPYGGRFGNLLLVPLRAVEQTRRCAEAAFTPDPHLLATEPPEFSLED
jgi:hypothetical protein